MRQSTWRIEPGRAAIAALAMLLAGCGADQRQPSNDPVALVFSLPADSWRSGGLVRQPIGTVEVTVIDARSERVTSFRGETTLALGNNPTGAHLRGSVTATISAGVARFDPVAIDQVGTGYTLVASSDGLPPVTSAPLDIVEPTFAPLPTGIAGGPITSIAVSRVEGELASAVFVGASDGVYRSVDGGATWKPASFGGEASAVLVADPVRPDLLYLSRAGDAGFVKQTSDAGATWRPLGQDDPATADNVRAVAIDPKNQSVIYAAGAHLHRSSDRGATWTHQPDPIYCAKLAVDAVSDTLYCSGFAVTRSTDGGAHWTVADTRIHPDSDSALVATPSGVFAGSDLFFYRSRDGGVSWDPVAVGRATAVTYTPLLPDQVYVATDRGIAVSQDGGAHFGDPSGPKDVVGLAADPLDFRVAYAASRTGVFVSRNSGASWEFASTGIDAHAIRSVALAPGAAQTMLASFHGALMRTVDGGTSWSVVAPEPSFTGGTGFAGFDPKVAGRAYACGDAFAISVDGGASFTPIAGPGPVGCTRILFHDATMTVGSLNRVYRSTSGGETWAMAGAVGDFGITSDLAFGDALGTVVLAAHGDGVFRSTDGADTFTQVAGQVLGSQLIADPRSPTHVVAATCGALQLSNDGGARFNPASSGPCVQTLAVVGSALVAAGTASPTSTRAVMSTNGGATWTPFDTAGVPRGAGIAAIAASDDGKTIYLGTTAGLYRSVRP